jgi:hypothetical protein
VLAGITINVIPASIMWTKLIEHRLDPRDSRRPVRPATWPSSCAGQRRERRRSSSARRPRAARGSAAVPKAPLPMPRNISARQAAYAARTGCKTGNAVPPGPARDLHSVKQSQPYISY